MNESREMQKAAIIMASAAVLNCRIAGMMAENMDRMRNDLSLAYLENDFERAIQESGCGTNDVYSLINGD